MERIKQKMEHARQQREALQRRGSVAQDPEKDASIGLLSEARRIFLPAGDLGNYMLAVVFIAAVLFALWLGTGGKPDNLPPTRPGEERGDRTGAITGLTALNSAAELLQARIDSLVERVDRLDTSVTSLESRMKHAGAATTSSPQTRRDIAASPLPETLHATDDDKSLAGYPAAAMAADDEITNADAAGPPAAGAGKPVAARENMRTPMTAPATAAEPAAGTVADTRMSAGPESPAGTPPKMVTRETPPAEPVQAVEKPPGSAAPDAPWVINLASSPNKTNAERFAARAKSRNINTELQQVTVKGTQYWRVRITGFSTREEAKAYAAVAKEKLGLKDVWITKR